MAAILDFGKELGQVRLPDDVSAEQARELMRTKGSEIRNNLIAQRMAQQREETAADEQIDNGSPGVVEKLADFGMAIPREAGAMLGKATTAAGRYLSQAPLPQNEGFDPFIAQENIRRMERTPAQAEAEFEASPVTQAGREFTAASEEEFPVIPGREGTLPVQIGGGVGSVLGLAPAALAGPAAPATAGMLYGASAAESAAEDADRVIRQRIASALSVGDTETAAELERKRFQTSNVAAAVTAPIGAATEGVLGIGAKTAGRLAGNTAIGGIGARIAARVASRITPKIQSKLGAAAMQQVTKRIVGGIEGMATEAAQEASEQVLSNTAARLVYDPDKDISEGVLESLVVGGLTGGIVGGVIGSDPEAQLAAAAAGDNPNLPLPNTLAAVAQTQPEPEAESDAEEEVTVADATRQREVDAAMKAADESRKAVTGETELVMDEAGNVTAVPVEAAAPAPAPEATAVAAAPAPVPAETQPTPTNAVQEPIPSEGVLREEMQAMGLPQVAEGGRPTEGEVEVVGKETQPGEEQAPAETAITLKGQQWLASPRGEVDSVSGKARVTRFKVRNPKTGAHYNIYAPADGKVFDSWEQAEAAGAEFIKELDRRGAKTRTNENGEIEFVAPQNQPALPAAAPVGEVTPAPAPVALNQLPTAAQGAIVAASRSDKPGIANSTWLQETVAVESLKPGNEMLWGQGKAKFKPRKSMTVGPLVVDSTGEVVDGNNRLYEAIQRGDKTIEIYREVKKPFRETRIQRFEDAGIWQVQERQDPNTASWKTTNFNSEAEAVAYAADPKLAPTRAPKPPSPEAQQRKDSQEFDRLLIEAGLEIGWVDNLDALAPQMQTAKQDATTIAAKLAKAKELGKLRYRAAQALGIDAQNTNLDFKKRAELLPALRTYVAEERQARALTDAIQPGEGKTGVNTSNLGIGDVLTVAEQPVRVVDVDADSGAITLEGGEQFGRTVIEDGAVIYVEKVEKAPEVGDFPEVEQKATDGTKANTALFGNPVGGYKRLPVVFVRSGKPPEGASGKFLSGQRVGTEKGVSVYEAWNDPKTGKFLLNDTASDAVEGVDESRPFYLVEGEVMPGETGSDGEPLLKPGTVRIVGEIKPADIVSTLERTIAMDGSELDDNQIPRVETASEAPRFALPAPAVLDAPESVADQKARLAREEAQAKAKKDREKLAELQAKSLTGSVGDIGQGDLLGGGDLFSAPAPKGKAKPEPWQMTRAEYSKASANRRPEPPAVFQTLDAIAKRNNRAPHNRDAITEQGVDQLKADGLITGTKNFKLTESGRSKLNDWRKDVRDNSDAEADASDQHYELVRAALEQGKPVPARVYGEYETLTALAAAPQTTGLFPPAQMQAQATSQAQAVAADAALQAEADSNLQQAGAKAIKLLDKLESDINGAAYSDPLFLTQFAKLAIKLARALVKGGMALDKAIRQAIAEARQQMPDALDNDAALEANLARAITEVEPVDPSPAMKENREFSRGLFNGEYVLESDEAWHERAVKWVDQFGDDLPRAVMEATGEQPMGGITSAQRTYILREIMLRATEMLRRQRNPYEVGMAKQVLGRAAEMAQANSSAAGANLKANDLAQRRYAAQAPILHLLGLIRERLQRLPFPELASDQLRDWVMAARQAAVQELLKDTSKADAVVAREFKREARDLGVVWRDVFNAALSTQRQVRLTMMRAIMAHPKLQGLSPEAVTELANLLGKQWNREHAKALKSEFSKFIPLPNVKNRAKLLRAMPRLVRWANLGILTNEAFRNAVAPEFGVKTLDGALVSKLTDMAQEAQAVGGVNRNRILDQMYKLIQKSGGISKSDFFRDYWYGAVLSAIRTQVDNAMSILNGALISTMLGVKAGRNAPGVAKAYGKGAREGIDDFWPILWHGEVWRSSNFNPEKLDSALEGIDRSRNIFVRALATPKYVKRLMTAIDHINGLSTQQAVIAYELYRDATPEEAAKILMPTAADLAAARARAEAEGTPDNLMNKRVREILQDTIPDEIALSARDIRELVTFTNKPKGIAGGIQRGLDAVEKARPGFKMLSGTVFSRFALNYANELANYAPLVPLYRYFVSAPGRQDSKIGLKMGQTERELLLAKMALGNSLGAMAAAMFLGDDDDERERDIDITGSFKSLDQKKRNQLLAEGRQPYSIRVGDTYISYRQLGFGGVLGAIGELRDRQLFSPEKWTQDDLADKILDATFAGLFIVKDSSAIAGLTEALGFMNSYKYDVDQITEKAVPKYLAKLGGSLIPNILKEVDAWGDPSIFKANSGAEFYIQQVPYLRRELGPGPMLNVLGEPVRVERYPWSRWVKQRQDDPAWETLGKLASKGVFLPVPTTTVTVRENGTRRRLTPEEQYSYQQKVGREYRKFVEANANKLNRMKPLDAADFIDAETTRIRTRVRADMQGKLRSDRR
jgi:hypothetical protein